MLLFFSLVECKKQHRKIMKKAGGIKKRKEKKKNLAYKIFPAIYRITEKHFWQW